MGRMTQIERAIAVPVRHFVSPARLAAGSIVPAAGVAILLMQAFRFA